VNDGPEDYWIFTPHAAHESTFRCSEQTAKNWFKKAKQPFVSKGRGKSLMVS